MNLFQKIHPQWPLRIGLGMMFLYSGIDMYRHPTGWTWAMPIWFLNFATHFVSLPTYFKIQGSSEILLALLLFAWFLPRKANIAIAAFVSFEIAGILLFGKTSIDSVTFRDLGVLGAGVGLFLLLLREELRSPQPSEGRQMV